MPWDLWVVGALLWCAPGLFFARKSWRWNRRRKQHGPSVSAGLALLAGALWPVTMLYWEIDSLRGERTWRGDE